MASIKPSSRYPSSFDSRSSASSQVSDPSSSSEFRNPSRNQSTLKRFVGKPNSNGKSSDLISVVDNSSSRALVKSKLTEVAAPTKIKQEQNLTSLVKKFMDKRSKPKGHTLVIPADFIAEDLKKTAAASKGSKFSSFQKKLFQKGSSSGTERKALTEVKSNTRTLAMVLRSERELLNQNQDYEAEITELKLVIEGKNREVEKLKDLCLNQREEIKALKSAILFPDVMNSHLQELLEKQGSELNQAKQVIPTLQRQVTSLTGQLQCLAVDLAEVKSDKYAARSYEGHISSPTTPALQEANNSLEYSSGDPTTPGSPDDMFLKDLNPCLTPYTAKYKDFDETMDYNSPIQEGLFGTDTLESGNHSFDSYGGKMFKSSEHWGSGPSLGGTNVRATRRSEENKCTHGKPMHHKLF